MNCVGGAQFLSDWLSQGLKRRREPDFIPCGKVSRSLFRHTDASRKHASGARFYLSVQSKVLAIRRIVETEMKDLRALLDSDATIVRAELARHIESITMTPDGEHYVASGNWNLVGRGSIDGAGARMAPCCRGL